MLALGGHVAIRVNDLSRAMAYFTRKGYEFDPETAKFNAKGQQTAIYFKGTIGGLSWHLVQK